MALTGGGIVALLVVLIVLAVPVAFVAALISLTLFLIRRSRVGNRTTTL